MAGCYSPRVRIGFLVAAALFLLCGTASSAPAADDAASRELASIEDAWTSRPAGATKEEDAAEDAKFAARYEEFAKKHAKTEAGVTAKIRLLALTRRFDKDDPKRLPEADRLVDEILSDLPRSPQLADLPPMWPLYSIESLRVVLKVLRLPDQPERVKAAVLLHEARVLRDREQAAEEAGTLRELKQKYGDLRRDAFTFGEIAEAELTRVEKGGVAPGRRAPDLVAKTLDGKAFKLSDLKGKVVVLYFASADHDAKPDDLDALRRVESQKVVSVWVSTDERPERARVLARREKLGFRVVFDGPDGPLAARMRMRATPTPVVIDPEGVIRHVGGQTIEENVRSVLAARK
jgi:cytochrome c biogenesis protein CcmG/thiol:disulfide interchange protein DsbE